MRATAMGSISMMTKWRITKSCRPLRGLDMYLRHIPGVPLTLHLRLYAAARIRGLRTRQNVGNDKALCCRLLRRLKAKVLKHKALHNLVYRIRRSISKKCESVPTEASE